MNPRRGSRYATGAMRPLMRVLHSMLCAVAACWPVVAEACPGCKAIIAERTSSLSASLAVGFYWSILVLLAVPFGLVAGMTWMLIRAVRRRSSMEMTRHGA